MVQPIGIRYYQLFNNGIGIIIYHQLKERHCHTLPIHAPCVLTDHKKGGSAVLDLASTKVSAGTMFYLSEDTFWGVDCDDRSQVFTYDPNSDLMASATRAGSVDIGSLTYTGTKKYGGSNLSLASVNISNNSPTTSLVAVAAIEQSLRQLGIVDAEVPKPYRGNIIWKSGYKLNYTGEGGATTTVEFGIDSESSDGNIPEEVQSHWDEVLEKASHYGGTEPRFSWRIKLYIRSGLPNLDGSVILRSPSTVPSAAMSCCGTPRTDPPKNNEKPLPIPQWDYQPTADASYGDDGSPRSQYAPSSAMAPAMAYQPQRQSTFGTAGFQNAMGGSPGQFGQQPQFDAATLNNSMHGKDPTTSSFRTSTISPSVPYQNGMMSPPLPPMSPPFSMSATPQVMNYTLPSSDEGKLSVSIDFGTTFSGVAYGSSRIAGGKVQQILQWPGSFENFRKIPTCLLYGEQGEVLTWGLEAKNASPIPGSFRCEWFKLFLEPKSCVREQSTRVCPVSPARPERLCYQGTDKNWRERLRIITEPEAAAVHCAYLTNLHQLRPSQNFMICDAGGGTVDLAIYKILGSLEKLEIGEVCARSGKNCGSLFLDLRFRDLVARMLERHPAHTDSASLAYFQHAFSETDKLTFRGEEDDRTPFQFNCFNVEDPDDASVFDPVVSEVLQLIEEQISKCNQPIHALLLVGGFSGSEYLFKRVDIEPEQQQFGSRIGVIARPADADTATCRGAARYGLSNRALVSSVIAPRAYIMKVKLPADPEDWQKRPAYITTNNAGIHICENRLQYLVQKGAILRKGQRVKTKFCKFSQGPQDSTFVAVLYTSESEQTMRYTDEGETSELCKWTVDLSTLPSFAEHARMGSMTGFYTEFELGLELDSAEVRGVLLYNGEEWGRVVFEFLN
ncbi:Actin-like ATPase protein [Rhizoctonia solani]|uniref:Actin-like ATPase protein n=2 Tax=Rhizoctonia solani TaxID=456999 RepID=A0A8H7LXZ1_9AGAM|nr:Actin-like ATPase protein [Rhizoctonia solani]